MIEMWDEAFAQLNPNITEELNQSSGNGAFELMHQELDKVWQELYRVLSPGGIACINIGDATRTLQGEFKLYPNHARILNGCLNIGFNNLPNILWRKQTNAPNKFMGSGMLSPGAYVTLEHEHILVLRKGNKRLFKTESEKRNRQQSAFFWEERNAWFSDLWDFKGARQYLLNGTSRDRSGAFPFELAYRLINMFSVKHDTVLDPFVGTGTTTFAAIGTGRNSLGLELDEQFADFIFSSAANLEEKLNDRIRKRIQHHLAFVKQRKQDKGPNAFKHLNRHYEFPVMTSQEKEAIFNYIDSIDTHSANHQITSNYIDEPVLDKYAKDTLFALN